MNVDVVKDVSILSTIPQKDITKFLKKFSYAICCGVNESILSNEDITAADIGIGILYIKHDKSSEIQYRFIPSKYLEKSIETTVRTGKNPLEEDLNISLAKKFIDVYKDLC